LQSEEKLPKNAKTRVKIALPFPFDPGAGYEEMR
jgi:hypothetical protein